MYYEYDTPEYEEWTNRRYESEKKCLEDAFKSLDDLYDILNAKLDMNLKFKDTIKKGREGDYIYCESEDLANDSGFAKFMFKKINITTFNSSVGTNKDPKDDGYYGHFDMSKEPESYYWMTVEFQYDTITGGSNGIDFATCWFEDGNWKVKFSDGEKMGRW